jgi:amino acid adenylation domain-containing protein
MEDAVQNATTLEHHASLLFQFDHREWSLALTVLDSARRWPLDAAIQCGSESICYGELAQRVQGWARHMLELGVGNGDRVVVVAHKRIEAVAAMLAANAAGAAFVPLDPNAGERRRAQLVQDAAPRLIVGPQGSAQGHAALFLDLDAFRGPAPHSARTLPEVRSDSIAYVLYTSGSTGLPKGVEITHAGVRAFFDDHNRRVGICHGSRCLNTSPFHFDVLLMDVMLPLYCGATVYLSTELPIPTTLLRTIENKRITHMYAVGTVLGMITGDGSRLDRYDLSSLRVLQTGAEVCNVKVVNQWLNRYPMLGFLNSYGPTEVSVGCANYRKPFVGPLPGDECPIGYLHAGCTSLICDDTGKAIHSRPAVGELWVAGTQVMRGYRQRPEEQSRVIVERDERRYYRTGDMVRCEADGLMWFVGRVDDQVKVGGHRIHLNEIQRSISAHPEIVQLTAGLIAGKRGQVTAIALETKGTPSPELASSVLQLARASLPLAVVPQALLFADELPRTPTGKVDRKRCMQLLLEAEASSQARAFVLERGKVHPINEAMQSHA